MPIRKDMRYFYPIDWRILSREIRFRRAGGRCERCRRPHGIAIRQLADGRWWDPREAMWRDDHGDPAAWPDIDDYQHFSVKTYHLSVAHLDHDPTNSMSGNLKALCQRCHLGHDRINNLATRRRRHRARLAIRDLLAHPAS
jgi:hypothetical protein